VIAFDYHSIAEEVVTMLRRKVRALLLGWAAIWLVPPIVGQEVDASKQRQLKIPSAGGEPSFVLRISAEGRRGVVSVQDEKGTEMQSLVCPLLGDNSAPTDSELEAVREEFVLRFEAKDLDFDGHKDLMGIREFGAKWARYCVWFYDPQQHIFVKDFLAEQMELLANLAANVNGQIVTSHLGPVNPWHAVYRIDGAEGSRPERQLVPAYSCLVETAADGSAPKAVVTTRYEGGQAIVQRQEAVKIDLRSALGMCSSLGRLRESQKSPKK
jgi:hypothetical protein